MAEGMSGSDPGSRNGNFGLKLVVFGLHISVVGLAFRGDLAIVTVLVGVLASMVGLTLDDH
jgi:hypothetical protein